MAFLMLLHEKMRLQRKQNKLTLKQLRNGNQLSRMESKIKRREKYYSKLEKQLETQANAMKNSASLYFNNMAGLGTNGVNLGNYNGSSAAALQILQGFGNVSPLDGKTAFNNTLAQALMCGAAQQLKEGKAGEAGAKYTVQGVDGTFTQGDIDSARQMINIANSQVSQMQAQVGQYKANYENNVSIWLTAAKEELEAQQEWEMDLLAEQQADYEAEKESIAAELELVKQRKESIEQELGSSIKDAAPKFGLA